MGLHTQQLTCGGILLTCCGHRNDYFEKDRLIEDTIEEFIIELGEDDSDDDDMMDKDDRQLIDEALQK